MRTSKPGVQSAYLRLCRLVLLFTLSFALLWILILGFGSWRKNVAGNGANISGGPIREEDEEAIESDAEDIRVLKSETVYHRAVSEEEDLADYSFALVVLTSTNGGDRTLERSRVFDALCQSESSNFQYLNQYRFSIYLSIDAVRNPLPLQGVPMKCNGEIAIQQWWQQSSSEPGFSGSPTGRIAAHYQSVLKQAFKAHTHVIFLEDDLVPAHDFVSLFVPTSPAFRALQRNPNRVWCVSAWNDLGVSTHASNLERLFLTDFFPGLGWMTTRSVYRDAIRKKWSEAATTGWDNWLRSNNDGERECVVPEVNRVRHVSSSGTNVNDPGNHLYGVFAFPPSPISTQKGTSPSWLLDGDGDVEAYELQEMTRMRNARRIDFYKNGGDISGFSTAGDEDVLIIYERSKFPQVLSIINAHPPMQEPRASRKGAIPLRRGKNAFIFLCDLVRCAPRVYPNEQFFPPTVRILRTPFKGKSCAVVCREIGLRCDDVNLQTIAYPPGAACVLMRTFYDCAFGCGHQVGPELPALVVGEKLDTKGQCLTGISAVPSCEASHPSTKRLCSCVQSASTSL